MCTSDLLEQAQKQLNQMMEQNDDFEPKEDRSKQMVDAQSNAQDKNLAFEGQNVYCENEEAASKSHYYLNSNVNNQNGQNDFSSNSNDTFNKQINVIESLVNQL